MAHKTQVNSATLILGVTGSGKSALARTLADYLWERWHKVLYYYTCDGGGFPAPVQEGIELGLIKSWRMRTRDPGDLGLAFETCARAAMGWWPRRINPRTGEVEPGVEMVPPVQKRWEQYCPQGHLVKSVIAQSLLTPQACGQCKVMVTTQNMAVKEVLHHSRGFEDRGAVFFDGLSSMISWERLELGHRAGRLELKGEEGAIGGKVVSGLMRWGGSSRSHYGFVQDRAEELCHLALGIPNLLVPPVFTALSMEASDEGGLSVVGPKIAGRAKTDEAGQWVGNCLETAKIPAEVGTGDQFCLYLSEFTDAQNRRHLLKHRGSPGTMPPRLIDPPIVDGKKTGQEFSQFNLGLFFRMLDEALTTGVEQARQKYPDAPGVADGVLEYGESTATVQGPAAGAGSGAKQPMPSAAVPATAPVAPAAPAAPVVSQAAVSAARRPASAPTASKAVPRPPITAPAPSTVPAPAAVAEPPQSVVATSTQTPPPRSLPPTAPAAHPAPGRPAGAVPPPGARPGAVQAGGPQPKPPAAAPRVAAPRAPAARPATAASASSPSDIPH